MGIQSQLNTRQNLQTISHLHFVGDPQIGSSNELKGKDTKKFYDAQSNAVKRVMHLTGLLR